MYWSELRGLTSRGARTAIPLPWAWRGRFAWGVKILPLLVVGLTAGLAVEAKSYLAYVGSYTGAQSKGIYVFRFDASSGVIEDLGLAAETPNPTFLALHPNGHFLYAANEVSEFNGTRGGAVSAYEIDLTTGHLKRLGTASTRGGGPCHLNVDATGRLVAFANYGGGSVGSLPILASGSVVSGGSFFQHTGSSIDANRQKEPHAHSINFSPDNRFALACDLGTDEVRVYRVQAAQGLVAAPELTVKAVPGGGPRHLTFGADGRHVYVNNEMKSSVTAFAYDPKSGRLQRQATYSTLPEGFTGNSSTAETRTSADGRWLFVSNRGHNSLARFEVNLRSGGLTPRGHVSTGGKIPRNFCLTPDGQYLWAANQDSDNVVVFRFDTATGALTPTGQDLKVGRPVCIRFLEVK